MRRATILIGVTVLGLTLASSIPVQPAMARESCGNWSEDVRDVKAKKMKCSNANRQLDRYFNALNQGDCGNFFDRCVVHGFRCKGERRGATRAKGKCKRLSRRGAVVWDQVLSH